MIAENPARVLQTRTPPRGIELPAPVPAPAPVHPLRVLLADDSAVAQKVAVGVRMLGTRSRSSGTDRMCWSPSKPSATM